MYELIDNTCIIYKTIESFLIGFRILTKKDRYLIDSGLFFIICGKI